MLNRVQLRAGLAVIYIAPRNLVQIGACASYKLLPLKKDYPVTLKISLHTLPKATPKRGGTAFPI